MFWFESCLPEGEDFFSIGFFAVNGDCTCMVIYAKGFYLIRLRVWSYYLIKLEWRSMCTVCDEIGLEIYISRISVYLYR